MIFTETPLVRAYLIDREKHDNGCGFLPHGRVLEHVIDVDIMSFRRLWVRGYFQQIVTGKTACVGAT
jgi:hypothetical protein